MSSVSLLEDEDPFELVFVCTGNRARSPLAEALFRERVGGVPVRVSSCGTLDLGRAPALPDALAVGSDLGVDLSAHIAHPIARGGLASADLVVGFEPFHVAAAVVDGRAIRERVFLIHELADLLDAITLAPSLSGTGRARQAVREANTARTANPPAPRSVRDPQGKARRVYVKVGREIDGLIDRLLPAFQQPAVPRRRATDVV